MHNVIVKGKPKRRMKKSKKLVLMVVGLVVTTNVFATVMAKINDSVESIDVHLAPMDIPITSTHESADAKPQTIDTMLDTMVKTDWRDREEEVEIATINDFISSKRSDSVLIGKGRQIVVFSRMYDIDPFRTAAIILWESTHGTSDASEIQKNVAGMNWSREEKEYLAKQGFKANVYNLKIYTAVDSSILDLAYKLRHIYADAWGKETLYEIHTVYCPPNDPRNGMDGMNNDIWARETCKIYYELEGMYDSDMNRYTNLEVE